MPLDCDKIARDSALRGAGILYVAGNLVLLGKRAEGEDAGQWDFPGGMTEEGETPLQTALRESREEVGSAPALGPDQRLQMIDYSDDGYIGFSTFLCMTRPFKINGNAEHTEWRWADINQLPKPLHPAVALTIEKFKLFGIRLKGDFVAMDSARQADVNGWVQIKDNPISKVGVFPYLGRQIDRSLEPEKTYMVLRSEEELSDPDTIDSFKLIPWIDEHVMLGPSESGMTAPEYKGIEGVIGENVYFDKASGKLRANLKMFTDNIDDLIAGGKRELSAGYRCKYKISAGVWNGKQYDAIQTNIRGNHLALVKEGRMGPDVAVLDHMSFTFDAKDAVMAEKDEDKKALDAIATLVKDGFKAMDEKYEALDKRVKDAMEEEDPDAAGDKKAKDEAEEKKKESEKAEDRKAMDSAIKSAMDAALAPLAATVAGIQKVVEVQATAQDAAIKGELLGKLTAFGFAVDGSDGMTLPALREAAVAKIGIPVAKGSEQIALDSFFHGRTAPVNEVGFTFDSASGAGDGKALSDFLSGKA